MNEFTKTKIHFALALLGTLFVLHPLVERYGEAGFLYVGYKIKFFHIYFLLAGLLAFAVYCYALALVSERSHSWAERVGNYSYAIALIVPALVGGIYLSAVIAVQAGAHWAVSVPMVALGLGTAWLVLSQLLAWLLRKRLGEQDRTTKVDELRDQEIASLNRARELFVQEHYDLSVIEAWKAIEARLRRALLLRGMGDRVDDPQAMIKAACRAGLVREPALGMLQELRRQWNIAVSTEPLTREAANKALQAARDILSTVPLAGSQRAQHVI